MPWVVGIDEAGYGPNLGPLVQSAVAVHLPDADPAGWATLSHCIRRAADPSDHRLLVDDSKKVHSGAQGLAKLERGALALFPAPPRTLHDLLTLISLPCLADVEGEPWYHGGEALPLACSAPGQAIPGAGLVLARVVPAPRFNQMLSESASKGVVLTQGFIALAQAMDIGLPPDEPVLIIADKQGGRNFYAGMLQETFPECWVQTLRESALESLYQVVQEQRTITVSFRPRADGESLAVALASMLAKYLREVCMRQFNRYWQARVPGIAPTAGYPVDAKRFFALIRPTMEQHQISEESVWRKR